MRGVKMGDDFALRLNMKVQNPLFVKEGSLPYGAMPSTSMLVSQSVPWNNHGSG